MNTSLVQLKEKVPISVAAETTARQDHRASVIAPKPRVRTLLAVPTAALIALAVHLLVSKTEPPVDTRTYTVFLGIVLGVFLAAAAVQSLWSGLRRWMT